MRGNPCQGANYSGITCNVAEIKAAPEQQDSAEGRGGLEPIPREENGVEEFIERRIPHHDSCRCAR